MVLWRQVEHSPKHLTAARQTYRPDLYRTALKGIDPDIPATDTKSERFFDGREFTPDKYLDWIDRKDS